MGRVGSDWSLGFYSGSIIPFALSLFEFFGVSCDFLVFPLIILRLKGCPGGITQGLAPSRPNRPELGGIADSSREDSCAHGQECPRILLADRMCPRHW